MSSFLQFSKIKILNDHKSDQSHIQTGRNVRCRCAKLDAPCIYTLEDYTLEDENMVHFSRSYIHICVMWDLMIAVFLKHLLKCLVLWYVYFYVPFICFKYAEFHEIIMNKDT